MAAEYLAKLAYERMDVWDIREWGQLPPEYAIEFEEIIRKDTMD